jgi:hypothetical protein
MFHDRNQCFFVATVLDEVIGQKMKNLECSLLSLKDKRQMRDWVPVVYAVRTPCTVPKFYHVS